jgi:hypothetical protein
LRLSAQSLSPSPASTTNPHRQSNTTRDLHAPKAHNLRHRKRPLPTKESQIASPSSFRPKLQPSPQCGVRSPRHPTDQDSAWTLKPPGPWLRRPTFRDAVHSANHLFARCAATYQPEILTEQGINEHCTVFLKALTASAKLRGGCGTTCRKSQPTECARAAAFHRPIATSA